MGKCNKCKSENITYGSSSPDDTEYYYEYTCENCKHEGREWYHMEYIESE